MTNWKKYKLGAIACINMGQSPKSDTYNNDKVGLPFFQGNKTFGRLYPTIDTYCSSPIKIAEENDILFSVRAPVGDINFSPERVCIGRGLCSIRIKKGSQKFLFYLLNYIKQEIINKESGTVFGSVNKNTLENISISIPDYETQTAIAEILSSLDDKIELNNKINQELENLAQTLFKQWFIDFEFPNAYGEPYKSSGGEMVQSELGEIPKGWEVGILDNILDVKGGTTPSTKEPSFWDGEFHWTSPRDLSSLQFPLLLNTEKKITKEGLKKISSGLLPKGTLLLSSRAPIGYLAITEIETAINQGYIAINAKEGFSNLYLLYWIKCNMALIIERANGSTFLEISKTNFKQIICLIPNKNILNEYVKQVEVVFEQLRINLLENQALTNLRDTLLPKLISGELEVAQAEAAIA